MEQKLVVHTKAGTIHKGITQDFDPEQASFHFLSAEGGGVPVKMELDEMKALFWVRDYLGNRHFVPRRSFEDVGEGEQKHAIVTFSDGEEIWGTVGNESDEGAGFFLIPADNRDNNVRIFVVRSALKELRMVS